MASQTSIANAALTLLGADRIAAITDATERAAVMAELWDGARDAVLAAHPWNFALRRASLAADAAAPAWGYDRQFTLPADPYCLRVLRAEDSTMVWRVEGRKLLTDEAAPFKLLYVARVTEIAEWAPAFCDALAARLAADAAFKLTNSREQADLMHKLYTQRLRDARSLDGQEGTPEQVEADELLTARL